MTTHITQHFRKQVLQDNEALFYMDMETHTHPLRHCAHNLAEFIWQLPNKTKAFTALQQAYRQLESMSIRELPLGINCIKEQIAEVRFYIKESNQLIMNKADVVSFFDKQNEFNAAANQLIQDALDRSIAS